MTRTPFDAPERELLAVDVEVETIIQRPRADVASFAGDPSRAPEWYVNIKSAQWQTPPPLRIGSKVAFVAHFLGRKLSYTYEITQLEPGSRLVMRTAEGPFPMETTYTWESVGEDATRMTLRNRGEPAGFAKLAAPLMSAAMRKATTKDLARLKRIMEARSR